MDVAEQLKDDLRDGRLDPERLVDLIVSLQRQLQAAMVAVHSLLDLAFPRSSGIGY